MRKNCIIPPIGKSEKKNSSVKAENSAVRIAMQRDADDKKKPGFKA